MTPQICQTRNDTISSDLPTERKRIRRAVELNGCYCGNVLSSSMAGVVGGWLNASGQAVKLSGWV